MKEGDVYRIIFKEGTSISRHCFENQLEAYQTKAGEWMFLDRYWGISGQSFTLARIAELGTLELICNKNEVEPVHKYDICKYKPEDRILLTSQHGCCESCRAWYVKTGTPLDKETMLAVLRARIETEKCNVQSSMQAIQRLSDKYTQIEAGNLKVTF